MSKLIGKKADAKFNAFAFETTDRNDQQIFMIGIFTDQTYDSSSTRSGWFQYNELNNPDIKGCLSSQEQDLLGVRLKSGKPFVIYLDKIPAEVTNRDGKPRYDCRAAEIVGFEVEAA